MAAAPIDLSAGLVPKPVDLSAGLVPKDQPDTRSLWQKAKDNFNANTQGAKPGDGAIKSFVENVGQGGGQTIRAIAHPLDTLSAMGHIVAHPLDEAHAEVDALRADPSRFIGNAIGQVGTGAILGEVAAPITRAATDVIGKAPGAYRSARAGVIGGSKLDDVITGDTVTPRQRYEAAKAQGVNLDTAQATNAPVAGAAKKITEHSLGGASKFEDNNAANVKALQGHSQKILDTASPVEMSREDFGNTAKRELVQDQQKLNGQAGEIYKRVDEKVGTSTPDTSGIQDAAQKIVDANKGYYAAHPDLLSGGAGRAWKIVNNLAKPGQDTWSNLHMLRSDLLDITRGPELVGERPTGWIKQLTGAVDDAMTKGLNGADAEDLREANDIYKYMKQTYDDPTSRLYHVVRSPDGLTAANTLANITPDVARKIGAAAPELLPQLQRQTISRILNPTGNDLPDLKNLSSRLSRAQKEQLAGVLTPEQIKSLDDLGRTSKLVTFDSNPSGSGKVVQKSGEAGALGIGAMKILGGVATANPVAVAEGAAPFAYTGAQRIAASRLTSPAFTDAVMNPPLKGQALWAKQGAAKLADSGLTAKDIEALSATPQGKSLLIRASSLSPGSPAMKDLVKKITP